MIRRKTTSQEQALCTIKRILLVILSVALIATSPFSVQAKTVLSQSETEEYLDSTARYILNTVTNPTYGSVGGEWTVMGLARYGTISDSYISTYKTNLKNELKSVDGVLSEKKYTEYARVVIALTAIEEDPGKFGGYNLLKPLAELDSLASQGANAVIYALIALDCGNYSIPTPDKDYDGKVTTRKKLVNVILDNQLDDGGWSMLGKNADSDTTAMAIQALAPYSDDEEVAEALERALDKLGEMQQDDGGYSTSGYDTCESTAQVLTAISVMNISVSDSQFVKNGNTVLDGLLQYYKDGGFSHFADGKVNQMATDQAMYALVAYWRNISGMNGLYEMTDGIIKRTLSEEESDGDVSHESKNSTAKKNVKNSSKKKSNKSNSERSSSESDEGASENNGGSSQGGVESENGESGSSTDETEESSESDTGENGESSDDGESETDENGEVISDKTDENGEDEKSDSEGIKAAVVGVILLLGAGGAFIYRRFRKK